MSSETCILVDTSSLAAPFHRDDAQHTRCMQTLQGIRRPPVTVWPALTAATDLRSFSFRAQDDLWEFVDLGGLRIADLTTGDIRRIRALMRMYHDRLMDLADAVLVRVAERERIRTVFTLGHRDFTIYRAARGKPFTLIPANLQ